MVGVAAPPFEPSARPVYECEGGLYADEWSLLQKHRLRTGFFVSLQWLRSDGGWAAAEGLIAPAFPIHVEDSWELLARTDERALYQVSSVMTVLVQATRGGDVRAVTRAPAWHAGLVLADDTVAVYRPEGEFPAYTYVWARVDARGTLDALPVATVSPLAQGISSSSRGARGIVLGLHPDGRAIVYTQGSAARPVDLRSGLSRPCTGAPTVERLSFPHAVLQDDVEFSGPHGVGQMSFDLDASDHACLRSVALQNKTHVARTDGTLAHVESVCRLVR